MAELSTARLRLRPYRSSDLDAVLAYYADADVARYLPTAPWTRADAEREIEKRVARLRLEDGALALVVELAGRVIGDVALWTVDETGARAEIGWVFHPDVHGRGYATEAVSAVLDLAFGHHRLHRVFAQLDPRNLPSARMCERLGMTKEAHLRQDWWDKGEWTDNAVYGLLRGEWESGQEG